jgi:RimJ/RimL family protein N-acetyltransferase
MKVISHPTVTDFWQVAGHLFTADPVRNTVAVTVLSRLLRGGRYGDADPILLTVHDTDDSDGDLVGAALCTPPFPIAVSAVPARAMGALADHLVTAGTQPGGASGLRPEVEAFVAAWGERTGAGLADRMDQKLYRLGRLTTPTDVPGSASQATEADVDVLADWRIEFAREAVPHAADRRSRAELVDLAIDQLAAGYGQLLWRVDDEPVALAAVNRPQSGMSRIGPVYTPPTQRGHGYGSAVTAAAGQWALDVGAEHVVLFTDLANPVSNAIYQRIGFVPVADALDVAFA